MRRLLPLAVAMGIGCSPPASSPTAPTGTLATPDMKKPGRPPQPMMANASWGEHVALELGAAVEASTTTTAAELNAQAITALHSLEVGSEHRAKALALQAWKGAKTDEDRGLALSIVAAAMVYDPLVDGYVERLIDAYGLSIYAGRIDSGGADGQSLRAIVGASGGASRQAKELVDVVAKSPKLAPSALPLLALARAAANDRSQKFFDDAAAGLRARPDSDRLRATLADRFVDLGFNADALAVIAGEKNVPALELVGARAHVLAGDAAAALPTLKALSTSLTGNDEARRSEAIFWFAEASLLADNDADAAAAAATLETRPGWHREGKLVRAEVEVRAGKLAEAKALLQPLTQGTPVSTMPVERRATRLMLDVSAALRDVEGVERAARRLTGLDVDAEASHAAREAVKAPAAVVDGKTLCKQIAAPDAATAGLLRARRALGLGAIDLATREINALIKNPQARTARALKASLPAALVDQAAAAAAALAGPGPALLEQDLVVVIDGLGAAPTPGVAAKLAAFQTDPRASVSKMATRSLADLANPESRKKRTAVDAHGHAADHDDGHGLPGKPAP